MYQMFLDGLLYLSYIYFSAMMWNDQYLSVAQYFLIVGIQTSAHFDTAI